MSGSTTLHPEYAVGAEEIEAEHALQYRLLDQAEQLFAAGDRERALAVVQQLWDLSDAHFASEQILMRLHSYPGYDAHLREHGDLLAALRRWIDTEREDHSATAASLRQWLTSHIQHADRSFREHLEKSPMSPE